MCKYFHHLGDIRDMTAYVNAILLCDDMGSKLAVICFQDFVGKQSLVPFPRGHFLSPIFQAR